MTPEPSAPSPASPQPGAQNYEQVARETAQKWFRDPVLQERFKPLIAALIASCCERNQAVVDAAKAWRAHPGQGDPNTEHATFAWSDETRELMRAVDALDGERAGENDAATGEAGDRNERLSGAGRPISGDESNRPARTQAATPAPTAAQPESRETEEVMPHARAGSQQSGLHAVAGDASAQTRARLAALEAVAAAARWVNQTYGPEAWKSLSASARLARAVLHLGEALDRLDSVRAGAPQGAANPSGDSGTGLDSAAPGGPGPAQAANAPDPALSLARRIVDGPHVVACGRYEDSIAAVAAEIAAVLATAERERDAFRQRAFGLRRVESAVHSTACLIWGDNGQGGTTEGFKQPLPCTCGASVNFERHRAEAAERRAQELATALQRCLDRCPQCRGGGVTFTLGKPCPTCSGDRAALAGAPRTGAAGGVNSATGPTKQEGTADPPASVPSAPALDAEKP